MELCEVVNWIVAFEIQNSNYWILSIGDCIVMRSTEIIFCFGDSALFDDDDWNVASIEMISKFFALDVLSEC